MSTTSQNQWISTNLYKGSEIIMFLSPISRLLLPWGAWWMTSTSSISLNSLCHFLNEWDRFYQKFSNSFAPFYKSKFNLARKRNIYCAIWLPPVILYVYNIKVINFFQDNVPKHIAYVFARLMGFKMMTVPTICYLKDFLLLETIQMGYNEVLGGIKAQYSQSKVGISIEQVQTWKELLGDLRLQISRVEDHIGVQNLWCITQVFFSSLLYLTMILFLMLHDELSFNPKSNFLPFAIIYTTLFVSSLYWKVSFAEAISATVSYTNASFQVDYTCMV